MTPPPRRPLTPLERAILRAVVDLGDEATYVNVKKRAEKILEHPLHIEDVCRALMRLEIDGFATSRIVDDKGRYIDARHWRIVGDLTAILSEEDKP